MDNGGPAFPVSVQPDSQFANKGMSLRDWFAGQVLCSASALPLGVGDYEYRAKVAYAQADAMIAERDRIVAEKDAEITYLKHVIRNLSYDIPDFP